MKIVLSIFLIVFLIITIGCVETDKVKEEIITKLKEVTSSEDLVFAATRTRYVLKPGSEYDTYSLSKGANLKVPLSFCCESTEEIECNAAFDDPEFECTKDKIIVKEEVSGQIRVTCRPGGQPDEKCYIGFLKTCYTDSDCVQPKICKGNLCTREMKLY